MVKDDSFELWEVISELKSHLLEVKKALPPNSDLTRQLDRTIAAATIHSDLHGTDTVALGDFVAWCAATGIRGPKTTRHRKHHPFPLLHSPRRFRLPPSKAPACASLAPPNERKGAHSVIARVSKATRPFLPFSP